MADGSELILGAAVVIVLALIAVIYWIDSRPGRIVPDEPYGDATDTPQMLRETRRVNHERRKS
jgi:hypothetical protein